VIEKQKSGQKKKSQILGPPPPNITLSDTKCVIVFGRIFTYWRKKKDRGANDTKESGPKSPHYEEKILKSPYLNNRFLHVAKI
jgi:hypothetical protein